MMGVGRSTGVGDMNPRAYRQAPRSSPYEISRNLSNNLIPLNNNRSSQNTSRMSLTNEPKLSLPFYSGTEEWSVFWLQFKRIASRYGWTDEEVLDRLVCCLRDEALRFFSRLPPDWQI